MNRINPVPTIAEAIATDYSANDSGRGENPRPAYKEIMKQIWLLLLLSILNCLSGVTREVSLDGLHPYTSIQSAINASVNGDIILAHPGRYFENVVISTSGITLQSFEATTNNPAYIDSTIIDGNATNTCIKVDINVQNILIRGFSVTNAHKNGNGGGIAVTTNSTTTIQNSTIYDNRAVGGGGVCIINATLILSGVKIYNNTGIGGAGGGLYMLHSSNYTSHVLFDSVNRCSIYNNRAGAGQDIFISDAGEDIEVYLDTFAVQNPSSYFAQYQNGWQENYQMNFHIQQAYFQEIDHDLYVSPNGNDSNDGLTPGTALKTIHTAIYRTAQDSLNPNTVHVLPGTYSVNRNQQMFPITMKSWVNLVGSGMENTILMGEHDPSFPDMDVQMISSPSMHDYTLSDFRLTYAEQTQGTMISGGNDTNIIIRNIKITDLSFEETNVLFFNNLTNGLFDNLIMNNLTLNKCSLIRIPSGLEGTFRNCSFTNCTSLEYDPEVWVPCQIWIDVQNEATLENCLFDHMSMADDDTPCLSFGGIENPPPATTMNIRNCQFSDLTGTSGVIVFGSLNNPVINITNSIFAGCSGSNNTLTVNGVVNIKNSILHNISSNEIYIWPMTNGEHTNLNLDYNCIRNGQAGISNPGTGNQINYLEHNTSESPRFLGGNETNPLYYSLAEDSPCIDTGTPDTLGLSLPIADLAGNYRIWNNRIDMGCYEYGSEPVGTDDPVLPTGSISLSNYPNPFNPSTVISCNLKDAATVRLNIYNIRGQHVKTLVNERMAAGTHTVVWNGCDDSGQACASGVYFSRLTAGDKVVTRKMVLIK